MDMLYDISNKVAVKFAMYSCFPNKFSAMLINFENFCPEFLFFHLNKDFAYA